MYWFASFVHKSPGRHSFQGFVRAGSDFTAMSGFSPSIHQSNAHPRSLESRGGHAFKEENSSRGMEVAPRVGSDDLESLRGSGGGFIRYERECTLPVVLLPVPLPAGRGRAHSALAGSQALCVSSDQNIASGVMQDQGGASISDTHSPELAEPALVSGPDRAVDSPSLANPGTCYPRRTARCGTRTRNFGAFMCGCFRVVRGDRCIAVSCDRHTHGSASTLYKTFVCFKMGSVCEMVPSGSYRPGYLHRVGCSEFPAIQAG